MVRINLINVTVNETTREDIPLKIGKKSRKWYSCNEDCFSGFKFVIVAFGSLTCVITVALLLQIYYGDYQVGAPHFLTPIEKKCILNQ